MFESRYLRLDWLCYLRDGYYILITVIVNKDFVVVVLVVVP